MSNRRRDNLQELIERFIDGDVRALAQSISLVEDQHDDAGELLAALSPRAGNSRILGITGPPGAGKSTLTSQFAKALLDRGEKVGMLLIDPSSPFTGGAILGDRIRMQDLSGRQGLYIRSLGSRGSLGGLSAATAHALQLLDCYGFDTIIVETVGTGQAETDVVETVDTVIVLAVPGLGDDIQAMKAGIMEIADVFVVNKADRDGAERTARQIQAALDMSSKGDYLPPVLSTVATKGEGISTLVEAVDTHTEYLKGSGELIARRKRRAKKELLAHLTRLFLEDCANSQGVNLEREIERVATGEEIVYSVGQRLFDQYLNERMGKNA